MENELSSQVLLLNCQAMSTLDKPKYAIKLLTQAENLLLCNKSKLEDLPNKSNLLAVTYNNLACYYKSKNQPNVSLTYLQKVLKIEIESFAEPIDLATTQLNLCAIYSILGKHSKAIQSCQSALKYLQGYENEESSAERVLNSLVAANYNLGVEYEIMRKYDRALKFYQTGHELASEGLGPHHSMTSKLSECLQNIKTQSNSLNSFIKSRRELREQGKIASSSMGPINSIKVKEYGMINYKASKLPSIAHKANKNQSQELKLPEYEEIENRSLLLDKYSGGFRRFSNAIDRLKSLLN